MKLRQQTILLLTSLLTFSVCGQGFDVLVNLENEDAEATLIVYTETGVRDFHLKSNTPEHIPIEANEMIDRIDLSVYPDTFLILSENPLYKLGVYDVSNFKDLHKDTLTITLDSYPFENELSQWGIKHFAISDQFPDFKEMKILSESFKSGVLILRQPFDMETHSEYYVGLIQEEVCVCMKEKGFQKATFTENLKSCFTAPYERIVPLIIESIEAYEETMSSFEFSEETKMDLATSILTKLNLYLNENCLKK